MYIKTGHLIGSEILTSWPTTEEFIFLEHKHHKLTHRSRQVYLQVQNMSCIVKGYVQKGKSNLWCLELLTKHMHVLSIRSDAWSFAYYSFFACLMSITQIAEVKRKQMNQKRRPLLKMRIPILLFRFFIFSLKFPSNLKQINPLRPKVQKQVHTRNRTTFIINYTRQAKKKAKQPYDTSIFDECQLWCIECWNSTFVLVSFSPCSVLFAVCVYRYWTILQAWLLSPPTEP